MSWWPSYAVIWLLRRRARTSTPPWPSSTVYGRRHSVPSSRFYSLATSRYDPDDKTWQLLPLLAKQHWLFTCLQPKRAGWVMRWRWRCITHSGRLHLVLTLKYGRRRVWARACSRPCVVLMCWYYVVKVPQTWSWSMVCTAHAQDGFCTQHIHVICSS